MKYKNILIIVILLFVITQVIHGQSLKSGSTAPFFHIKSGEGNELNFNMIKGKEILIFYETKNVVKKNRQLKDKLNKFYDKQPEAIKISIVRLSIINCSSAFWPFTGIWENQLRENSKKEGITIYGDWDGKMFSDYSLKNNESNVIIIDKKGVIKYFNYGKINEEDINTIIELLKTL